MSIPVFQPLAFFILFTKGFTVFILVNVIIFLFFGTYRALVVPRLLQSLIEFMYKFIYSMIMQQAGIGGKQYFAIFFTTFCFILFSNILGLMPYGFTTTSHLMITLSMAFTFNFGFILLGFYLHGLTFLKLFCFLLEGVLFFFSLCAGQ